MTSPLAEHLLPDMGRPPEPFDWATVVRVCAFFAAVLFVADLFFT